MTLPHISIPAPKPGSAPSSPAATSAPVAAPHCTHLQEPLRFPTAIRHRCIWGMVGRGVKEVQKE